MKPKDSFPPDIMSGIVLSEVDGIYHAKVRIQLSVDAFKEHYLQAQTQSSMMALISTIWQRKEKN